MKTESDLMEIKVFEPLFNVIVYVLELAQPYCGQAKNEFKLDTSNKQAFVAQKNLLLGQLSESVYMLTE